MKTLKRFDWTDNLLMETEKKVVKEFVVENHDGCARHRMDIGMNTEFEVKLFTAKPINADRPEKRSNR